MRKAIIILGFIITMNSAVYAGQYSPTIGKIENSLYGFQYDMENDINRLDRIEKTVYGESSTANITQRVAKIKKDISADAIGQEITPKEDTFADESDKYIEKEPLADSNINYPIVDELEQQIFKQTYPKKDIKERLTTLEQKTFGKTYISDNLSSRVERLKAEVKPPSFMDNHIAQSSNDYFDADDVVPLEKNYHLDRYESPNQFDYNSYNTSQSQSLFPVKKANITAVENSLLKRSFQNDTMDNRLSRLENTMFGSQFKNEDEQTRFNRISSAYKAQKSSNKYDSNKFSQNVATAVQIGTILLMVLACIL